LSFKASPLCRRTSVYRPCGRRPTRTFVPHGPHPEFIAAVKNTLFWCQLPSQSYWAEVRGVSPDFLPPYGNIDQSLDRLHTPELRVVLLSRGAAPFDAPQKASCHSFPLFFFCLFFSRRLVPRGICAYGRAPFASGAPLAFSLFAFPGRFGRKGNPRAAPNKPPPPPPPPHLVAASLPLPPLVPLCGVQSMIACYHVNNLRGSGPRHRADRAGAFSREPATGSSFNSLGFL